MIISDKVAEKYIQDAIASGELDNPEWHGKPLPEDDLTMVPEEFRMVYRILKNSGFIPEEVGIIQDINRLERELTSSNDQETRKQAINRLTCLYIRLEESRPGRKFNLVLQEQYYNKLVARFKNQVQD